jgi:HSP20 family molecular chaperone IbpA
MNITRNFSGRGPVAPERVQQRATVAPRVDVYENRDELLLVADLPGANKDGVNVHFDKGHLTIDARRSPAEQLGTPVVGEHLSRDYHRVFAIPQGIDTTKIDAQFFDGVLKVHLPKADALKPRRVEVKAG